jgi:hypothetical protein
MRAASHPARPTLLAVRRLAPLVAISLLALLTAGCGDDAGSPAPVEPSGGGKGEGKLYGGACPGYLALKKRPGEQQIEAASRGEYEIFNRRVELEPPVDWEQDPYASEPWRKNLHKFSWMAPLLEGYRAEGDREAIERAKELVLDWAGEFPEGPDPDLVWERKLAADRMGVIGFVLLAADCEGLLNEEEGQELIDSIRAHVAFIDEVLEQDSKPSNHTLLAYSGLVVAARQLDFLGGEARDWRERGLAGFEEELSRLVDPETGVHLEHSPTYQKKTVGHVERFLRTVGDDAPRSLTALAERMREISAWFAMPDGNVVPFGDTPFIRKSPAYAVAAAQDLRGLAPTLATGYAFAREDGSYLGVTAGYHTDAHKQPDELSFVLYEGGRRVIVETGRPNKAQDPDDPRSQEVLDFALSSRAHSTLTVDGESFQLDGDYYGSGLYAQGSGDGWYAIEGTNRLLKDDGVEHRRLFLYRPGEVLVIADRVRSSERHTYDRYLQVAPEIDARLEGDEVALTADDGFAGSIWDAQAGGSQPPRLYEGDSGLRGYFIPIGFGPPEPRPVVDLRSSGRSFNGVATIAIGTQEPVTAKLRGARSVKVDDPRRGALTVSVKRDRETGGLTVTESVD